MQPALLFSLSIRQLCLLSWAQAIDRVVKLDLWVTGSRNLFTSVDLQTDRFIHCQASSPATVVPSASGDDGNKDIRL